jgi:DNA-binding NtrC family response regulator
MSANVRHFAGQGVDAIIGVSYWARRIRAEILRVAGHDSNVLITGPSGTGKELVARAICAHGSRRNGPLVPVDCAALPGELFASQLFGHLKGAFTGAHYAAVGAFRAASGGTIFLDEIGELDPVVQAKLLRVIQERMVVPLGSHESQPVDVRIIAATNRNLDEEVRAGRFREDLYYRLNVISLKTVPLKDRPEDIESLADRFLCKLAIDAGLPLKRLSPGAITLLLSHDWPGNVRELQNQLERAAIHGDGDVLGIESMPELVETVMATHIQERGGSPSQLLPTASGTVSRTPRPREPGDDQWPTMAEVERQHILSTLEHTHYNQCAAAVLLGMDRHALRRKMRKHGLDATQARRGRPARRSLP